MNRMLLVAVALMGCSSEPGDADTGTGTGEETLTIYDGNHIVVHADPDFQLCGGALAHMDNFIERLSAEFGTAAPTGDARIQFHWQHGEDVAVSCGASTVGCTNEDGTIHSQQAPLDHEIVHAVASQFGWPHVLFAEGLAVAYQDIGHGPIDPLFYIFGYSTEIRDLIDANLEEFLALEGYRPAGSFTAHLITKYGISTYLQAYSAIEHDAAPAEIDQVFLETFGVSLDDSIDQYEAEDGKCRQPQYAAKIMECGAPEIDWDGMRLSAERALSCEQEDAIGPFDDKVVVLYTLEISHAGVYELRMYGDNQEASFIPTIAGFEQAVVGVSLRSCGGCDSWGSMETWIGSTPRLAELPAGRYSLRLHGFAQEAVTLGFSLSLVPDPQSTLGG